MLRGNRQIHEKATEATELGLLPDARNSKQERMTDMHMDRFTAFRSLFY